MSEAKGIPRIQLTTPTLFAEAKRRAGHDEWGDMAFEEGLNCLLYSLENEANLSPLGRLGHWNAISSRLTQRLLLNRAGYNRISAEIADRPTLVIAGAARTGTTLLQRMLALDKSANFLRGCDVMVPVPATLPGSEMDKAKIAAMRQAGQPPQELLKIHEVAPGMAEEELWLFDHTFFSLLRPIFAYIPTYLSWFLKEADPIVPYAELKQMLAYVGQHRRGSHWILKAPQHQHTLGNLLDTFSKAQVIWTHRDPVKIVPSACSLYLTARQGHSNVVDAESIGQEVISTMAKGVERAMVARDAHPGRVVCDVHYEDLLKKPAATVREIYETCGMIVTDEMVTAIEQYVKHNPKGKHGEHVYSAGQFGLTEEAIRERFSSYMDRFDVRLED